MSPEEIRNSYNVGGILEATGVADSLPDWSDAEVDELERVLKDMHKKQPVVRGAAGTDRAG